MEYLSVRIDPAAVMASGTALSKKQVFEILSKKAASCYSVDPAMVLSSLHERESLGSTGFGGAVAIPHARIAGLKAPVGLFISLADPIGFDAHDGQDVDLVFGLLSPQQGSAEHLKALAEVSRFLRDENTLAKLRGAASTDALYALLTGHKDQQAA